MSADTSFALIGWCNRRSMKNQKGGAEDVHDGVNRLIHTREGICSQILSRIQRSFCWSVMARTSISYRWASLQRPRRGKVGFPNFGYLTAQKVSIRTASLQLRHFSFFRTCLATDLGSHWYQLWRFVSGNEKKTHLSSTLRAIASRERNCHWATFVSHRCCEEFLRQV